MLLICLVLSFNIQAQQRGKQLPQVTVSGKVIDLETKQALEYATVIFTPLKGKKITGGITDRNGAFEIQVSKNTYDISVEFISFKTKTLKSKKINSNTANITTKLRILLSLQSKYINDKYA